jgi:phosphopantothenoylcysteine decarboxylase/phosphopantothenate--cysteine ligase
MTPNAAKFINPILFKTLTNNDVYVDDFDYRYPLAHVKLADWADVFVIAPATANTIAKIAHGIADNLLTSNFLAFDKRKILFPAMNVHMLDNPLPRITFRD